MLDKIDYGYNDITLGDSIKLSSKIKQMNIFEGYELLINEFTTLDARQIEQLPFQDAISILLMYLLENFDNPEISDNPILTPKSFLVQTPNYNEQILNIGKYRFSNTYVTLQKAKDIEKYCYSKGDKDLLGLYLLAGSCLKGMKEGVETIVKGKHNSPELINDIKILNELISQVSYAKIDMLVNVDNISIISTNKYLSLQNSFFFYI